MARPACDGPAAAPISNRPRSWSFVESGRLEEGGAPEPSAIIADRAEAEHVAVEGDAAREVADVQHRVVEPVDGWSLCDSLR